MKYLTALFLTLSFAIFSFSYFNTVNIRIKGTVTDGVTGDPVASAVIRVKGSNNSTVTGPDGIFSISVPHKPSTLVCNATGYESQEIIISGTDTTIGIKLQPETQSLKEYEMVDPGSLRKNKAEDRISSHPHPLQGAVSGISVIDYSRKAYRHQPSETYNHNTEDYDAISENRFLEVTENPLSTFSVDVDGASYSNVRRFLQNGQLPPAGSVRIEELINYFHYDYPQPKKNIPFSINTEAGDCPWNNEHKLVMIGLQGRKIPVENLPSVNLVFLIDVSGSMMDENKLPLVKASIKLLVEQLREEDRVSIVVYAGNAGLVLPATSGANKRKINDAVEALEAGGSTAGGAGIQLAYKVAKDNYLEKGNNRVILCTDGDFNVGVSSDASLEKMIEQERKSGVFLTVLGYGMGNYKDNKMQKLANKGNGNHAYIDNLTEAKKVLVNEFGGTLFTIAKDVKLQVEFNPAKVQAYRLIGYENRMLNKEDFNNDKKDAGEIGSGHTVTALYEIIPAGVKSDWIEKTDPLKYRRPVQNNLNNHGDELMTIKFRYKQPDGEKSHLIEHPVRSSGVSENQPSHNFRFVTAVAQFGMLLGNSEFKQGSSFTNAKNLAMGSIDKDTEGYRKEFLLLIDKAAKMAKGEGLSSR